MQVVKCKKLPRCLSKCERSSTFPCFYFKRKKFSSGKKKLYNLHFLSNRKKLTSSRRHHLKVTLKIIPPKRSTNKHNIPTAKMYIKIANTRQSSKQTGWIVGSTGSEATAPQTSCLLTSCRVWSCRLLSTGLNRRRRKPRRPKRPTCPSSAPPLTWAATRLPWWWEEKIDKLKKNGLSCGYSEAR